MQRELFEVGGPVVEASKFSAESSHWLDRFRVTLRPDHLLITAILALVLYVLVFSFGVEKGKQFALAELEAAKQKQVQIARQLRELKQSRLETTIAPFAETDPAPPPSEMPASPPAPAPTGEYTIQVITFTNQPQAEREVERWTKRGHQSFIIPSGKFFQVCVELFGSAGEARERLTQFRQEGFVPPDAYVRPFKGQIAL